MRLGEEGDDDFVDAFAGCGFDQLTKVSAIRLEIVGVSEAQ